LEGKEFTTFFLQYALIRAAFRTAFALAVNDVHRRGGFLDFDVRAWLPPSQRQCGVNQLMPRLGFVERESVGLARWVVIAHASLGDNQPR